MSVEQSETRNNEHSIYTVSGTRFWPLQPRADEVNIHDIAHALSNMCRFTGHTKTFYSVAQHCVLAAEQASPENALWALLHDASEAYLADIARPVKGQMPEYKVIEERLMKVIAEAFELPWPMPAEIHEIDARLLMTEKRDLMPRSGEFSTVHGGDRQPYPLTITGWTPNYAKDMFLLWYRKLTKSVPAQFQSCGLPGHEIESGCVGGSCGIDRGIRDSGTIRLADMVANGEIKL